MTEHSLPMLELTFEINGTSLKESDKLLLELANRCRSAWAREDTNDDGRKFSNMDRLGPLAPGESGRFDSILRYGENEFQVNSFVQ